MASNDQKHQTAMENFSIPGLPELPAMTNIKLRGPTEIYKFHQLWELMLCNQNQKRKERMSARQDNVTRTILNTGEVITNLVEARDELLGENSNERVYAAVPDNVPDSMWQSLYMQSAVALPARVHATLWAPFADPATGELPTTDLNAHMLRVIPDYILEKPMFTKLNNALWKLYTLNNLHTHWVGPRLSLSCHKPVWEHKDGDNNYHSHLGPAAVWADGSCAYMWRGIEVPLHWIPRVTSEWMEEHPTCPTPVEPEIPYSPPTPQQVFKINNVEHRRIACEILGFAEIIKSLKSKVLDKDPDPQIGTLLQVQIPVTNWGGRSRTEPHNFLQVECGTGRIFALSVPLTVRTARQANAWTYGLDPDEYQPEVRT